MTSSLDAPEGNAQTLFWAASISPYRILGPGGAAEPPRSRSVAWRDRYGHVTLCGRRHQHSTEPADGIVRRRHLRATLSGSDPCVLGLERRGGDRRWLITTDANELLAQIHNRMPLIIAPKDYARWLSDEPDPRDLMVPFPTQPMRMWPISTRVNKPNNDDPSIVEPIKLESSAA